MVRHLARNVTALLVVAAILLTMFEVSNHRVPVLPADASPGPVLAGALLLAVAMTVCEQRVRRLLR
jgi:riboflavin transporter FmnP